RADGILSAILTIGFVIVFISLMILLIKPMLARFINMSRDDDQHRRSLVAIILAVALASALLTEVIGIHALFGAFLAGVIMPPIAGVRRMLKEKLETFSLVVLLPLFFAFTG